MLFVAVFDTNVLFSAIGWRGAPYQCVELARSGQVRGLTCREILDELADILARKLRFSDEQIADSLTDLLPALGVVEITGNLRAVAADPADDKVIECAVAGQATHIVTGDRRHLLPMITYAGIQIVRPAEFMMRVSTQGSTDG